MGGASGLVPQFHEYPLLAGSAQDGVGRLGVSKRALDPDKADDVLGGPCMCCFQPQVSCMAAAAVLGSVWTQSPTALRGRSSAMVRVFLLMYCSSKMTWSVAVCFVLVVMAVVCSRAGPARVVPGRPVCGSGLVGGLVWSHTGEAPNDPDCFWGGVVEHCCCCLSLFFLSALDDCSEGLPLVCLLSAVVKLLYWMMESGQSLGRGWAGRG